MAISRLYTLAVFFITAFSVLTLLSLDANANAIPQAVVERSLNDLTPANSAGIGGIYEAFRGLRIDLHDLEDKAILFAHGAFDDAAAKFDDAKSSINEFQTVMNDIVDQATIFRTDVLETHGVSTEEFSEAASKAFEDLLHNLREAFPSPDEAPGHEEREQRFRETLLKMGDSLAYACKELGLPEKDVRDFWSNIVPALEKFLVLAGDLIEQHPTIAKTILITSVGLVLSELPIFGPMIGIFGFQPGGVAKGSLAAWAQSYFYGAEVQAGSIFAQLQRIGAIML